MRKLILFIALMSLLGNSYAQRQGIKGQIFWLSGNQMPGPGKKSAPHHGIQREVHIYNATHLNEATQQNGFFSDVQTTLVARVMSNPDGTFKVKLPPGRYSVFVKENGGLFANLYDSKGCINCIAVSPRRYTWVSVTVDYEAAY